MGIFGGTFDPPHLGHVLIAEEALRQLRLDRILFMPASDPWMKDRERITDVNKRVEMTALAAEGNSNFVVSRMEADRAGPTYTADTLTVNSNKKDFQIISVDFCHNCRKMWGVIFIY